MARPERDQMPASLNELMGKATTLERLEDLPGVLGERMPEIEFNEVGKMRLMRALKNRFGEGFRNLPGVTKILQDFDDEVRFTKIA